jgi:hypothetical protein
LRANRKSLHNGRIGAVGGLCNADFFYLVFGYTDQFGNHPLLMHWGVY